MRSLWIFFFAFFLFSAPADAKGRGHCDHGQGRGNGHLHHDHGSDCGEGEGEASEGEGEDPGEGEGEMPSEGEGEPSEGEGEGPVRLEWFCNNGVDDNDDGLVDCDDPTCVLACTPTEGEGEPSEGEGEGAPVRLAPNCEDDPTVPDCYTVSGSGCYCGTVDGTAAGALGLVVAGVALLLARRFKTKKT